MSTHGLLYVEGLRFAYDGGGRRVLDGLSLRLDPGQVTAILGPNGAGKTTLLHTVLGVLRPQAGRILLEGRPLASYRRSALGRLVGLVPQVEHVAFEYSVEEYVLLGRAPHLGMLAMPTAEDRRAALRALEGLDLLELQRRPVLELSGGERQMVVLARALAQGPRLLLMDEPLAHLDLSNKARILAVIRRLAAAGTAVLFTTHEPDLAPRVAGQVVLMRGGRLVASGPTEQVMTSSALSETYGVPIRVLRADGEVVVRLERPA